MTLHRLKINTIKINPYPEIPKDENLTKLRLVILEPVGFPIKINGESLKVSVEDIDLFNKYAREQWVSEYVNKGGYLFDNTIIPDYAFKVIDTYPTGGGIITSETEFRLASRTTKTEKSFRRATFNDIIGQEDAKRKCKIIMKYLKQPELFGEWAPKNILFYGPPGTGKTLMARALATETDVPLYMIKSTELIGDHVGDGSRQIQELYSRALENRPCIIFIDELDAIGLSRQYQSLRGDVSEVVNALLTELDGIHDNDGIITIGATNNPSMLDGAIRSRFEEEIKFEMPNENDRLKILELYAKKMPLKVKCDLKKYAKETEGMCGRDIKEKLLKPALHKAILEDRDHICDRDLDEIIYKLKGKNKNVPENLYG